MVANWVQWLLLLNAPTMDLVAIITPVTDVMRRIATDKGLNSGRTLLAYTSIKMVSVVSGFDQLNRWEI